MDRRLSLSTLLREVLGSENVYFQPPESRQMQYPCISYEPDRRKIEHADNVPYADRKGYQLVYMTRNPDDVIPDKLAVLPLCRFDRHYVVDNLHHYVFILYF